MTRCWTVEPVGVRSVEEIAGAMVPLYEGTEYRVYDALHDDGMGLYFADRDEAESVRRLLADYYNRKD